jgi:hypothetical protein
MVMAILRIPELMQPFVAIIWDGYCIVLDRNCPDGWVGKR